MQKLPKKGRYYGLDKLAGERFEVKVTVIISIVITYFFCAAINTMLLARVACLGHTPGV